MTNKPDLVCVGEITTVHGVRGLVKIRPYTEEPDGLLAYGAPTDALGEQTFRIELRSWSKGSWIASVNGIDDRSLAEKLRGQRLFVPRDRLPPPDAEDEFYYHDLTGLPAFLPDGAPVGRVRGVANHGAGDILEIETPDRDTLYIPFTKDAVPVVDVAGRRVVIDPPRLTGDADPDAS